MNKHAEAFRPTKNGHRRVDGYLDHLCLFNADPRTIHFAFDHWKVSEIRIYIHENVRFSLLASLHNEDAGEVVTKIAFDKICIVPPSFRDHPSSLIHHVEFKEGQHIPLARLIVLVWTIKHYSKAYACTNKNSYWLCYAIGEALKRRYDHTILRPLPRIVQQRRTLIEVINFDDLLKNYDDMWDSPIYKVCMLIRSGVFITDYRGRSIQLSTTVAESSLLRQEKQKSWPNM